QTDIEDGLAFVNDKGVETGEGVSEGDEKVVKGTHWLNRARRLRVAATTRSQPNCARAKARRQSTRMHGRCAVGSTSTMAPLAIACVMSRSKPEIMVKPASAAPCTMIGLTALSTSAAGMTPRAVIALSIQAVATPPLAASSTSTRPT